MKGWSNGRLLLDDNLVRFSITVAPAWLCRGLRMVYSPFSGLSDAKAFAREALLMGYWIEAGTTDGIEQEIRIRSQQIANWASSNSN